LICNILRNTEASPRFLLNSNIRHVVRKNGPLNPVRVHITLTKSNSLPLS